MKPAFRAMLMLACAWLVAGCSSDDAQSTSNYCHDGCVATMAAKCSNGPKDQATCESDCKALETSACSSQYKAVQTCSQGKPVTCDADGKPSVAGCDPQFSAFVSCLLK
jgi:hypothetical protein